MDKVLKLYIDKFNSDDREYTNTFISNADCFDWLFKNIPLIDIPDKEIEEIYYFRYWVLRKHIKNTEDGKVVTEFLVPVPWASKHNTIVAAIDFHISEAKWLKSASEILESHIELFLSEKADTYRYSTPIIDSVYRYCQHTGNFDFGIKNLDAMINYYCKMEQKHKMSCGLMCAKDDNDATEYTISGSSSELVLERGFRVTFNCYMAANALAISKFADMANRDDIKNEYFKKHTDLKSKINEILWDGTFYKSIHGEELLENPSFEILPDCQNVKELMGYVPWIYGIAPEGRDKAFEQLKTSDGFYTEYGLSTAEARHSRYLFEHPHECLWNGYIWPFATSLVLKAVLNLTENYNQNTITKLDFYNMLRQYALSCHMVNEEGKKVCWIDEVISPVDGSWHSRNVLKSQGWPEAYGGFERGKDYNHSSYCDFVLAGLLGIDVTGDKISVNPKIPEDWNYFKVSNLTVENRTYDIIYDKDGTHYGEGKGLIIRPC